MCVTSKGDGHEGGVVVLSKAMQVARLCYHTMRVSYRGAEKGFLDFLTLVDEG